MEIFGIGKKKKEKIWQNLCKSIAYRWTITKQTQYQAHPYTAVQYEVSPS